MGKALFKWINGSFHPLTDDQLNKLSGKIKQNQVVELQVNHSRSLKSLGYYWTLMQKLSDSFGELPDKWHLYFKSILLPLDEFTNGITGERVLYPSSVSFEKMDETDFKRYLDDVINYCIENGVEID
jgi:hypothetical protein